MSIIIDFKVINVSLKGSDDTKENMPKFIKEINTYLDKGYTLHGNTIKDGVSAEYQKYAQAVVKYSGPIAGPVIKKYTLQWCYYPEYGDNAYRSLFERNILDEIRDGYTLHGDLHYVYSSERSTHCYSQALVKISNPKPTIAEDIESMRANITKHAYTLADFQEEVANHNRAIAELRLNLETQTKIIRRQKRLIDELNNTAIKHTVPEANLLDI